MGEIRGLIIITYLWLGICRVDLYFDLFAKIEISLVYISTNSLTNEWLDTNQNKLELVVRAVRSS